MIVQRYPRQFHPFLRGQVPLVVTGPAFKGAINPDRAMRPFWRLTAGFVGEMREAARELSDVSRPEALRLMGQLLLEERIVQAVWVTHTPDENLLPPAEQRFDMCVSAFCDEVPLNYHGPNDVVADVLELLDGMSDLEHYRSMFAQHDQLTLTQQIIVV